jgi:hypothetical protein
MTPDALTDGLLDRSLPFSEWTHTGHLTAAYVLTRRLGPPGALDALRTAIPAYNEAVNGPAANTDSSGYHETITCYYAWAVAAVVADGGGLEAVLADPRTRREGPLAYWRRETLFSTAARRAWVPPDLGLPSLPLAAAA